MNLSKFNEDSLLENILINNVFFIELLNTCGNVSGSFDDFYRSEFEEVIKVMGIDSKARSEYNLSCSSEFSEYVTENKIGGILLSFSTPKPYDFRLNENGEFLSCSLNWGNKYLHTVYAQTLEDALHQAIKIQEDVFNERLLKEKEKAISLKTK